MFRRSDSEAGVQYCARCPTVISCPALQRGHVDDIEIPMWCKWRTGLGRSWGILRRLVVRVQRFCCLPVIFVSAYDTRRSIVPQKDLIETGWFCWASEELCFTNLSTCSFPYISQCHCRMTWAFFWRSVRWHWHNQFLLLISRTFILYGSS